MLDHLFKKEHFLLKAPKGTIAYIYGVCITVFACSWLIPHLHETDHTKIKLDFSSISSFEQIFLIVLTAISLYFNNFIVSTNKIKKIKDYLQKLKELRNNKEFMDTISKGKETDDEIKGEYKNFIDDVSKGLKLYEEQSENYSNSWFSMYTYIISIYLSIITAYIFSYLFESTTHSNISISILILFPAILIFILILLGNFKNIYTMHVIVINALVLIPSLALVGSVSFDKLSLSIEVIMIFMFSVQIVYLFVSLLIIHQVMIQRDDIIRSITTKNIVDTFRDNVKNKLNLNPEDFFNKTS